MVITVHNKAELETDIEADGITVSTATGDFLIRFNRGSFQITNLDTVINIKLQSEKSIIIKGVEG